MHFDGILWPLTVSYSCSFETSRRWPLVHRHIPAWKSLFLHCFVFSSIKHRFNSSLSAYSVKSLSQTECRIWGSTLTSLRCWSPGCQDEVWPDFSWHRFFLEQGSPAGKENISVLGQSCFLLRGIFHATQSECHLACNEGSPLYLLCWNSCRLQLRRDIWPIDLQNWFGKFTI